MRKALVSAIEGTQLPLNSKTSTALSARNLLSADGSLTSEGWDLAVVFSNLDSQCKKLGIFYEQVNGLNNKALPEETAYEYFQKQGFLGTYCEGGAILLLIRSAALEVLANLNTFQSRDDARTRFTEAQLYIHSEHIRQICTAISVSTSAKVEQAFEEIYRSARIREWFPGLDSKVMGRFFDAIGGMRLAKITEAIAEAPYEYRSGWPDLTLVDDAGGLLWVEVKTTDKLHLSQVKTIRRMLPLLPGKVGVVHLL
jgi:hypothetical protein